MANVVTEIAARPPFPRDRLIVGGSAFAAGVAVKIVGTALMAADLSAQWRLLTGVLLVSIPKLLLVVAIVVLGKDGFLFIRDGIVGGLRPLVPAGTVSRRRYALGLFMFWLPLGKVWAMPYLSVTLPESVTRLERWDFVSDIMLIASFLVLGGDFWDKLRALFIRSARVAFPAPRAAAQPRSVAAHVAAAIVLLVAGQVGFLAIRPAVMASGIGDSAKTLLALVFVLLPAIALVVAALAIDRVSALAAQRGVVTVSVTRYRIGLALIIVPLLGEIIVDIVLGAYAPFQGRFKGLLDLMLLGGLFALGPEFWDKLRAVFDHRAKVELAPQP